MPTTLPHTGAHTASTVMFASFSEAARRTGLADSAAGFAVLCDHAGSSDDVSPVRDAVDLRSFVAATDEPAELAIGAVEFLSAGRLP